MAKTLVCYECDKKFEGVVNVCPECHTKFKQLQAELTSLKEFARHVIKTGCWNFLDFEQDGCELKDLAEKLGLIESCIVTAEDDYEDFDVGDTIYKFTDILKG